MQAKFDSFSTGTQMRQYSYNDTHMTTDVDGVTYVTEITEEQVNYLNSLHFNDYINPARLFDEASNRMVTDITDASSADYND